MRNILVLAPQPFFLERGTPIAVRLLVETLCQQGYRVHLLTYAQGQDIAVDGLTLDRIPKLPFIRGVPIGISWQKIICDFFLSIRALRLLRRYRFDVVHAVEEMVYPVAMFKSYLGCSLIYDMDSCLADQVIEKMPFLLPLKPLMTGFEKIAFTGADHVLPVCELLAKHAAQFISPRKITVLEDIPFQGDCDGLNVDDLRKEIGIHGILALYVGNLEHYQGIDLLIEALFAVGERADIDIVCIGGRPEDIRKYRNMSAVFGVKNRFHLIGPRPLKCLGEYLRQADILLSPRLKGVNTPMKIYSYMAAGRPIMATAISSHTQVLDKDCSFLVAPAAATWANGFIRLSADRVLMNRLGDASRHKVRALYSRGSYTKKLITAYRSLERKEGGEQGQCSGT